MVDFIYDIYKYSQIIPTIKEVIRYCYQGKNASVKSSWKDIQTLIPELCENIKNTDWSLANDIISACEKACSYTTSIVANYKLMGDELELALPMFYKAMSYISTIDVTEGDYRLFSSRSGFLSLESLKHNHIYHSSLDPLSEASEQVLSSYLTSHTQYHIVGCGLGYFPYELFKSSDQSLDIYIHHISPEIVNYAFDYGLLDQIPAEKLHIMLYDTEAELLKGLSKFDFTNVHHGLHMLDDATDLLAKETTAKLYELAITTTTQCDFNILTNTNLWKNLQNVPHTIYELPVSAFSDEWMVVVAGPSLDDNIAYIKENRTRCKIICASTVYRKLLANDIIPDYVCVCDPQARTYGHIDGISNNKATLLLESTANWRFGEYYDGPKYLVPSSGSETSLMLFESNKIKPFIIHGTVADMCILMAQHLGAKIIHLIGLDLAYPNGKTHASGTMDCKDINPDSSGLINVPCASGGYVLTSPQFLFYINIINELLSSRPDITYYNHSKVGAAFEHTICI